MARHLLLRVMSLRWAVFVLVGVLLAGPGSAADWDVVLNGRAVHVNAKRSWNERNWGLGVEGEFESQGPWVKLVVANGFKDSRNEMSYMTGAGIKRRFRISGSPFHVDLGVVAFLMTREDVNDGRPFPGILPTLTFGTPRIAVNATYLPDAAVDGITKANLVDPSMRGVFFFQLKLDAALFSPSVRNAR